MEASIKIIKEEWVKEMGSNEGGENRVRKNIINKC